MSTHLTEDWLTYSPQELQVTRQLLEVEMSSTIDQVEAEQNPGGLESESLHSQSHDPQPTERPWQILYSHVPGYSREISIVDKDHLGVCRMVGAGSYNPRVRGTVQANTDLIVAAVNSFEKSQELLNLIATASINDPGESDLDNEQPITVHLTLKEVRLARRLLHANR